MLIGDVSILMLPGWTNSGQQHWQSIWERGNPAYRRVQQADWDSPKRGDWIATIAAAVGAADNPVVLVAHSLGCLAAVGLAAEGDAATLARVAGAFLVAPPDIERRDAAPVLKRWAPIPRSPLPFQSMLIASRTDEYAPFAKAEELAPAWGSTLVDLGDAGHINTDAGYGPWPEGHAMLERFIAGL